MRNSRSSLARFLLPSLAALLVAPSAWRVSCSVSRLLVDVQRIIACDTCGAALSICRRQASYLPFPHSLPAHLEQRLVRTSSALLGRHRHQSIRAALLFNFQLNIYTALPPPPPPLAPLHCRLATLNAFGAICFIFKRGKVVTHPSINCVALMK